MEQISPRDFGRLEAEVQALRLLLTAQVATLSAITLQLDAVRLQMSEAKGGWRTLVWLGSLSATLGGFLSWGITHLGVR